MFQVLSQPVSLQVDHQFPPLSDELVDPSKRGPRKTAPTTSLIYQLEPFSSSRNERKTRKFLRRRKHLLTPGHVLDRTSSNLPQNSDNKYRGLYFSKVLFEGLIYGGKFAFQNRSCSPYKWKEIYRFSLVLLCIWGQFPSTNSPRGGGVYIIIKYTSFSLLLNAA